MKVFVRVDQSREVHELVATLRHEVEEAKLTLDKIDLLSRNEGLKISEANEKFHSMEGKLETIKTYLLEPERI